MPATPKVPTALAEVRVQARRGPGVPDVVLVGQVSNTQLPDEPTPNGRSSSGKSTADDAPVLGPGAGTLGVDEQWLARYRVPTTAGSVQVVPLSAARPDHGWLLSTGQGSAQHWRAAGAALIRASAARVSDDAAAGRRAPRTLQVHLPPGTTAHQAAALTLGCVVGSHRYRITSQGRPPGTTTVRLVAPPGEAAPPLAAAVARAQLLARATGLARDLANTPSGHKDPAWLAGTAARLAATVPGLHATVRDEHWLAEHGFGGVLAVGGGSARPPRLLELAWRPAEVIPQVSPAINPSMNTEGHLVLVGKGITFDTGGISIKPADNMHLMRTDMSGGAAVIAALLAVGQLKLPLRVTGLVPCAENHVSGSALRPGDVVRHVGGTTTEVANTDAEGRLVLADALAHAVRTLRPTALVDVATLTGAMKVSLGLRTGGLFATEAELADRIRAAGEAAGEDWWPMPLVAEHADEVRSDIADLRQCPPGPAGITAALFLREFTTGLPWAHLDIAGPARAECDYDEVNAGGTGFATRTLIELACSFNG
ncbi:MAG: leucyl aminopeptidase family protein [Actinomycetota bacterium]|nr:leucyl aminopeptidase family protein [Actinomycetota bacterium]